METIVVALLGMAGTVLGSYLSHHKTTALVAYRLEQLEKKVDLHNKVVERTYHLEESDAVQKEQIKVINHRLEDLEKGVGHE